MFKWLKSLFGEEPTEPTPTRASFLPSKSANRPIAEEDGFKISPAKQVQIDIAAELAHVLHKDHGFTAPNWGDGGKYCDISRDRRTETFDSFISLSIEIETDENDDGKLEKIIAVRCQIEADLLEHCSDACDDDCEIEHLTDGILLDDITVRNAHKSMEKILTKHENALNPE